MWRAAELRVMPHLRLGILVSVVAVIVAAPEARACSCYDDRPWSVIADSSDVLFLGKLVEARLTHTVEGAPWLPVPDRLFGDQYPNAISLVFEVERWWNGSGRRRVEVQTDRSSCALPVPDLGADMLIEAERYRGGTFTFLCLRSVPIYSAGHADYLATDPEYRNAWLLTRDSLQTYLGAGFEPSGSGWFWWALALGIGAAGFVIWRKKSGAA